MWESRLKACNGCLELDDRFMESIYSHRPYGHRPYGPVLFKLLPSIAVSRKSGMFHFLLNDKSHLNMAINRSLQPSKVYSRRDARQILAYRVRKPRVSFG